MLTVVGDVRTVLEGRVTEKELLSVAPNQFRFALGAGTFSGLEAVGEAIIIESKPFVSWVEKEELKTSFGSTLRTPFLVGITEETKGERQERGFFTLTSLNHLYEELSLEFPSGFALAGRALLSELHGTYLKKPPIYQENINEEQEAYWSKCSVDKNRQVFLFGIVVPKEEESPIPSNLLNRIFYQNPQEKASAFRSHTHTAIVQPPGVRHLLTTSLMDEGVFSIFPFN